MVPRQPFASRSPKVFVVLLLALFCAACSQTTTIQNETVAAPDDGFDPTQADWSNFGVGNAPQPDAVLVDAENPDAYVDSFPETAFVADGQPSVAACTSGYEVLVYDKTSEAIASSNQRELTETAVSRLQRHIAAFGPEADALSEAVTTLNGNALEAGGWTALRAADKFRELPAGIAYTRYVQQLTAVVETCASFSDERFVDDVLWAVDDLAPVGSLAASSNIAGLTTFSHSRLIVSFPDGWATHASTRNATLDVVLAPSMPAYRADAGSSYVRFRVIDSVSAADFEVVAAQAGHGCTELTRKEGVANPQQPEYIASTVEYSCQGELLVISQHASSLSSGIIVEGAHDGTAEGYQAILDIVSSLRLPA